MYNNREQTKKINKILNAKAVKPKKKNGISNLRKKNK
ncbi:MAG: Uncharacterised protein [Owenweeksia sp. TMED14]|nr:MAG: Uncharacterised protein [Owenweeksia sp. TMED14]